MHHDTRPLLALIVVALRADGYSFRTIARSLGITRATARSIYYSTDTTKAA